MIEIIEKIKDFGGVMLNHPAEQEMGFFEISFPDGNEYMLNKSPQGGTFQLSKRVGGKGMPVIVGATDVVLSKLEFMATGKTPGGARVGAGRKKSERQLSKVTVRIFTDQQPITDAEIRAAIDIYLSSRRG